MATFHDFEVRLNNSSTVNIKGVIVNSEDFRVLEKIRTSLRETLDLLQQVERMFLNKYGILP